MGNFHRIYVAKLAQISLFICLHIETGSGWFWRCFGATLSVYRVELHTFLYLVLTEIEGNRRDFCINLDVRRVAVGWYINGWFIRCTHYLRDRNSLEL